MPHDYMSVLSELEDRATVRPEEITANLIAGLKAEEQALNRMSAWVECTRCGRMRREDSYCQCWTPEEKEYAEAMCTRPDHRSDRQRELIAIGPPRNQENNV